MIGAAHKKKDFMFSYKFMGMSMQGMASGRRIVEKDEVLKSYISSPDRMYMQMHMLMGMYGFTNRLTGMVMVNYVNSTMKMIMHSVTHSHSQNPKTESDNQMKMQSYGFSDPEFFLIYKLFEREYHKIEAGTGVSIPIATIGFTGNSGSMYDGTRLPYNMQPGSGTWDLVPFFSYYFQHNRILFSSQVSATKRLNYNKFNYRLGNEFTINNWAAFRWSNNISTSLRYECFAAESIEGSDPEIYTFMEPSANPENYGGLRMSAFLGVNYNFHSGILKGQSPSFEIGIPVYQKVNGIQMLMRTNINFSWTFNL